MKCEYARGLIMTDYIDGRLSRRRTLPLEEHLAACPGCREFMAEMIGVSMQPLQAAGKEEVPDYLWNRIRMSLDVRRGIAGKIKDAVERRVLSVFVLPQPVLVRVIAAVLVLVTAATAAQPVRRKMLVNNYLQEQMTYVASLDIYGNGTGSTGVDLGTDIEAYLF